jgi:hypothetical protein
MLYVAFRPPKKDAPACLMIKRISPRFDRGSVSVCAARRSTSLRGISSREIDLVGAEHWGSPAGTSAKSDQSRSEVSLHTGAVLATAPAAH